MIKVGILGTGFGEHHAKLYKKIEGLEVAAIFGRNQDKLQKINDELKIKTTTDIYEIIQNPDIDVIDICLPTELHSKWAVEALKNNKHVFCETPVSYLVDEAEEIKSASVKYGRNVYVDMFIKFSTPHSTAIEIIKKGELGRIQSLRSYNKTSPRWGDLSIRKNIETFHIHNIDFMCEIMGMPENATATAMNFGGKSIVTSVFYYGNRYATLESNSNMPCCRPFDIGFEIVFENGVICYDAVYGEFTREDFFVFKDSMPREVISLNMKDEYEEVFKHLLFCLANNIQSDLIDISHAINSIKIKEMIIDSLEKEYFI